MPSMIPTPISATLAGLLLVSLCSGAHAQTGTAPAVAPPPDLSQLPEEPSPASHRPSAAAPASKASDASTGKSSTTSTTTQGGPNEPVVQHTVIEDDGTRIEETRVRGQLQRITVTPKGGKQVRYEILPGDGSGSEASRSAAGKRVWNVLQF